MNFSFVEYVNHMRQNLSFRNQTFKSQGQAVTTDERNLEISGMAAYYRVGHQATISFLPRDARSAKRGIAIVSRPSVRPSVRLSVTLPYREHIGCTSSKLITRIISLGSSLLGPTTSAI